MAKKKKYPKSPKQSASFDIWKRYEERVKEVDKFNSQLEKYKTAKKTLVQRVSKMKAKR